MHDLLFKVAQLLYFVLPAYIANMAPPFVKYWRGWNRPISRRWLGEHKTVVGFIFGILAALFTTYVQSRLNWSGSLASNIDWRLIGAALGFGAMGGDSLKSLFKRARGIAPGQSWMPADQLDFIVGALIFALPWVRPGWPELIIVLAITFAGHVAVNHLAYWLKIRDTKW
jgi:CDP-2,3-bis-(O-geranylgeranyl)-sn-glycerol synthase